VRDARAIAALHGAAFHYGWSDGEIERMLIDRAVLAHRALRGASLIGFILSRRVVDEAEILSVAVASAWRGRGLARRLLDLHLRRLAGLGARRYRSRGGQHAARRSIGAGFRRSAAARAIIPIRPARAPPRSCCVGIYDTCL
jgi:ribosomal-protein-alanine N-acetyltransferase